MHIQRTKFTARKHHSHQPKSAISAALRSKYHNAAVAIRIISSDLKTILTDLHPKRVYNAFFGKKP